MSKVNNILLSLTYYGIWMSEGCYPGNPFYFGQNI